MDLSDSKHLENRKRVIGIAAIAAATHPVVSGLLILSLAGLAVWSVMNVAGGVVMLGLYPDGIPLWAVYAFVAAIQTPVTLFSVLLPLFFSPLIWTSWFSPIKLSILFFCYCVIVIFFVAFEVFHQVALQTKNATGKELLVREQIDIDQMHKSIDDSAGNVKSLFNSKVAAFKTLAIEAEAGRDVTGIAKCGPICKTNREKVFEAIGAFSDLELSSVPPKLQTADLLASYSNITARITLLESLEQRLTAFYKQIDGTSPPASVSHVVAAVKKTIEGKQARYAGMASITEKSLALEATKNTFFNLFSGLSVSMLNVMALLYGSAPFLASIALGIPLALIFQHKILASTGIAGLEAEVAAEEVNRELLGRLKTSRMDSFKDAIKAKFNNWRNL